MDYHERREKFLSEVKALGEKYQIGLVGTCENEGIYGEITVVDIEDPSKCYPIDLEKMWNFW